MDEGIHGAMGAFQGCIERRDRVAAEQLLDDDFALVLVEPARAVMDRGRWLDVLKEYVIHEYVIDEQVVDVVGDCAAALHRVRMRATVLGNDRSGTFVLSDMWRLRNGSWRIWRRHSTPLSAGSMPGMKV